MGSRYERPCSTIDALVNDELQLSKKYHPDKTGGDISKFHEINDAYATLGDESKRYVFGRLP